jgi:hypothetical protein
MASISSLIYSWLRQKKIFCLFIMIKKSPHKL